MQNELKEKTEEVEELSTRFSELELSESCDLSKSKPLLTLKIYIIKHIKAKLQLPLFCT